MTQTIGNALAERDSKTLTPYLIVTKEMGPELSSMLPSHIPGDAWLKIAAGALKKSKIEANGRTELENAAANNPVAFVAALRQAASLGLQPGSDEYYFTTVRNWQNQNRKEILGIVGYQGYVELMYRAGAVQSVVVELVYSTDKFTYVRGVHERPIHETDWDADERGDLRLAYAYANMKGGAVSKVVILNKHDIAQIRAKSASWAYDQKSNKETSPWTTSPDAMWLKSAARQLRKWVPTSANYITEQLRAAKAAETAAPSIPDLPDHAPIPDRAQVHISDPEEVVDGVLVDDLPEPPQGAPATSGEEAEPEPEPRSAAQQRTITTLMQQKQVGGGPPAREFVEKTLGIVVEDPGKLSSAQADRVIEALRKLADPEPRQ